MRVKGPHTSFSPSFEPLTHRSFAYSSCFCDSFLLPTLFFEAPGAFAPFFSPVCFSWCSHAHGMRNEMVRRFSGRKGVYRTISGLLENPVHTRLIPASWLEF